MVAAPLSTSSPTPNSESVYKSDASPSLPPSNWNSCQPKSSQYEANMTVTQQAETYPFSEQLLMLSLESAYNFTPAAALADSYGIQQNANLGQLVHRPANPFTIFCSPTNVNGTLTEVWESMTFVYVYQDSSGALTQVYVTMDPALTSPVLVWYNAAVFTSTPLSAN